MAAGCLHKGVEETLAGVAEADHGPHRGMHDVLDELFERRALVAAAEQQHHGLVGKGSERLYDGIGVGSLGIVDVAHAVDLRDRLDTMLESRKRDERRADILVRSTDPQRRRSRRERVELIVRTPDAKLGGGNQAVLHAVQAHHKHAFIAKRRGGGPGIIMRKLADGSARRARRRKRSSGARIFHAHDSKIAGFLVGEDLVLGGGVGIERAVPRQMVGRDVHEHRDARMQHARRCQLVARKLCSEP